MSIPTYVTKSRHGIYYLRLTTPLHLLQHNPALPREIRKSLRTRSRAEAATKARALSLNWGLFLQAIRPSMDNKPDLPLAVHRRAVA